jgi:thiol-disulfide isomerase/thioredoxin
MYKTLTILFLLSILIISKSYGQFYQFDSLSTVLSKGIARDGQQIHIGEKVPEIKGKMINYAAPEFRLSDQRGKWVILDFWSNGCEGCIAAMPRMEKLQEHFKGKLLILPISFQSAAESKKTLDKVAEKTGTRICSIVEDTSTYSLFSAYTNPFEVWINPEGKLIAMTSLGYVTQENIQAAIDGKPIDFPDFSVKSRTKEEKKDSIYFYGSLLSEDPARHRIYAFTAQSGCTKIEAEGTLVNLFIISYGKSGIRGASEVTSADIYPTHKRIIANFNKNGAYDSTYFVNSYTPKNQKKGVEYRYFTYEKIASKTAVSSTIYKKMIADLDDAFHMYSSIEKRKVKVLLLVKTDGFKAEAPVHGKDVTFGDQGFDYNGVNGLIKEYINEMNLADLNLPLVYDSTGIKEKIHLPLQLYRHITVEEVRKQLRPYHLDLIPSEKEMYMLVLTKKKR